MIDPRLEEQAALAALGWAADPAGLDRAAQKSAELGREIRAYADAGAMLAYDAPQFEPPRELRGKLFSAIGRVPVPEMEYVPREKSRLRFPRLALLPYALAACLMGLALFQIVLILALDNRLDASHALAVASTRHDPFAGLQLVDLAPQGDHGNAKIMVAWNGKNSAGMVSMSDMPEAPAGHDYQLWVLDPSKPAPVSAGVVPHGIHAQRFVASNVQMPGRPGFAVSLEPAGGRPSPTEGAILFAVAPSP